MLQFDEFFRWPGFVRPKVAPSRSLPVTGGFVQYWGMSVFLSLCAEGSVPARVPTPMNILSSSGVPCRTASVKVLHKTLENFVPDLF
jgi:hypothetical protein